MGFKLGSETFILTMNVLILYPQEMLSYSKFKRKVSSIFSVKIPDTITTLGDHNLFIKKFIEDSSKEISLNIKEHLDLSNITHAIIFDDGEVFPQETALVIEKNISIRRIKIKITRVLNIKRETQYKGMKSNSSYEYIGRGSYWGNPYSMHENGDDRDEVIRKFKYDFDHDKLLNRDKNEVFKLAGKRLGCFCKPEACHGDVIADFLNSLDDGE